jgi:hypothetical protein
LVCELIFATTSAIITDTARGNVLLGIDIIKTPKGLETEIDVEPIHSSGKKSKWAYKLVTDTHWPDIYGQPVDSRDQYHETRGIVAEEIVAILDKATPPKIRIDAKLAGERDSTSLFLVDASSPAVIGDLARMVKARG